MGGPIQCQPDNGDDQCDTCLKENCCDESIACVANFECLCMVLCFEQGGGFIECAFICGWNPQESPELLDLAQCSFAECPDEC